MDGIKCDGHGICSMRCPELIAIDKWGYAMVSDELITSAVILKRANRAVRSCPEGALELQAVDAAAKTRSKPLVG